MHANAAAAIFQQSNNFMGASKNLLSKVPENILLIKFLFLHTHRIRT